MSRQVQTSERDAWSLSPRRKCCPRGQWRFHSELQMVACSLEMRRLEKIFGRAHCRHQLQKCFLHCPSQCLVRYQTELVHFHGRLQRLSPVALANPYLQHARRTTPEFCKSLTSGIRVV